MHYSAPYNVFPPPETWSPWMFYCNIIPMSMCFMGSIMYGDIIPFTISEETITTIAMILGRLFISFLYAEAAGYVSSQYSAYDNHMRQRNKSIKWIELNDINASLRMRVEKYYNFKWYT